MERRSVMERFRAHSLFQPSNFVEAMGASLDGQRDESPKHLFGAILTIPHTQTARVMAVLGYDFIFVDALHTAINAETLVAIIQTVNFVSEGKTCAIVRIPSPDSDLLTHALDAGAAGIIFPQVDTPAHAAAAVDKVRYAYSGGNRSLSPVALLDCITNTAPAGWTAETIADRNIAVICQIESALGVENVNAIARTHGVNALMLGAGDLRVSLNLPARNPVGRGEDPKFYAAVSKLVAAAKSTGMPLMIPAFRTNLESVDWLRDFKLIITGIDILSLVKAQRQELAQSKQTLLGCQDGNHNGNLK